MTNSREPKSVLATPPTLTGCSTPWGASSAKSVSFTRDFDPAARRAGQERFGAGPHGPFSPVPAGLPTVVGRTPQVKDDLAAGQHREISIGVERGEAEVLDVVGDRGRHVSDRQRGDGAAKRGGRRVLDRIHQGG